MEVTISSPHCSIFDSHKILKSILHSRGIEKIPPDKPLWKLKLSDDEYEQLKSTLIDHSEELDNFGMEAAICYAEWWRRDYNGNIPSKEDVAVGIGLNICQAEELYMAARMALQRNGFTFIHSFKRTEYFRTLLNQGGLPIRYIRNNEGNMGNFTRFLKGLVKELSSINYDWNNADSSIIRQFSCVSYLGDSFKNDNIYDVSIQIARAIIMEENALLPYDDSDKAFAELTDSLKREFSRAKSGFRLRPLSLQWRLHLVDGNNAYLYILPEAIKDLSSESIPGLNITSCYSFDVFVAGVLTGKYVRKETKFSDEGQAVSAVYTRISMGPSREIRWNGEPVVEVKIRCDNDDRIFLTIAGSFAPNFDYPQVFQMLDSNIYAMSATGNSEKNIALFSESWSNLVSTPISIAGHNLFYEQFSHELTLTDSSTGDTVLLENKFTPYTVEFSNSYIPWLEHSNFKLLSSVPIVRVYDKEKERVNNIKIKYRDRHGLNKEWRTLKTSCVLPPGIVDICVETPDSHRIIETFYCIGDIAFTHCNEGSMSTEMYFKSNHSFRVEIEKIEGADVINLGDHGWRISRCANTLSCPSECGFRIYRHNAPVLKLSIAIPFEGVVLTDVYGGIVPRGKIISFANLAHYCIMSHGRGRRRLSVSYFSNRTEDDSKIKSLDGKVYDGIVSLTDYKPLIDRIFNLYGANSFNRSSCVTLNISGNPVFVRKFVLESTIKDGMVTVIDNTEDNTDDFLYEGEIYAFPVGNQLGIQDLYPVMLIRKDSVSNTFAFPEDFCHKEVIVFSGAADKRRIVPKYYNREEDGFDWVNRKEMQIDNISEWEILLADENVMFGGHWKEACKAFELCSTFNLPFSTHNALRSIVRSPNLIAKFILAMWLNGDRNVLEEEIDRFEQELEVALHWIPVDVWQESINDLMGSIPEPLMQIIVMKLVEFTELLVELMNATVTNELAQVMAAYITTLKIDKGPFFSRSDINEYKSKIRGLSDNNMDLPVVRYKLQGKYYPYEDKMLLSYRVMIESAMCAAENASGIDNRTNLFAKEYKEHARIANFYRKYFKETYCNIFLRTLKYINSK